MSLENIGKKLQILVTTGLFICYFEYTLLHHSFSENEMQIEEYHQINHTVIQLAKQMEVEMSFEELESLEERFVPLSVGCLSIVTISAHSWLSEHRLG